MQQEEPPTSASSEEYYEDADLAAAITDALNDNDSSVGGGGSFSETSSFTSLQSINVTQELNELLRSTLTGDGDTDGIDIDAREEKEQKYATIRNYQDGTVIFNDVDDTKKKDDKIDGGSSHDHNNTTNDSPTSALFETISSSSPHMEQKEKSKEYSSPVSIDVRTTTIEKNTKEKLNNIDKEQKGNISDNRNKNSPQNYEEEERKEERKEEKEEEKEIRSVPLKQFENALALIQDLENRIQVLETDQHCLIEENTTLKEETLKQAEVLVQLEEKLKKFPKLLEETVAEEAQVAATKAETKTRISFWKKDMQRQEKEHAEEKLKKQRQGSSGHNAAYTHTTESLKQSDFLQDVVERKETEEHSTSASSLLSFYGNKAETMTPTISASPIVPPKNKVGLFPNPFRRWGKGNKNDDDDNNDHDNDNDNGEDTDKVNNTNKDENDIVDETNDNATNKTNNKPPEKKSKKKSSKIKNSTDHVDVDVDFDDGPELDASGDIKYGVDDNQHDEKVLDLMT